MNDFLLHHGIKGQKWGIRRYQNPDGSLTSEGMQRYRNSKIGYEINKKAISKEPYISEDIKKAISKTNSKLYGFENRLKTIESINRKKFLGKEIKDALRYTIMTNDDDFVKNYFLIRKELENAGYHETRCKNYFDMFSKGLVKHKSVQSNFIDNKGYEFEIQFQTPQSQKVKDLKVPLYEEVRKPDISFKRKKEIEDEMEKLALEIKDPKDISKIISY